MNITGAVANRRAIEALRAGVPNGDAVRVLGSNQSHVISAFDERLEGAIDPTGHDSTGFVVAGGFGTGKSHLVEELHQRALARNYVSSRVSVSKETPLNLPARVVQAATRTMASADKPEGLLLEMAMTLRTDRPAFHEFKQWCDSSESGLAPLYGALLELREMSGPDADVADLLVRYWSGEVVTIPAIKAELKEFGLSTQVAGVPAIDRPWQTVRFIARLCQTLGFRGWVIFLDETELISKYGTISRARAYNQLGRWLGLRPEHRIAGTAVVATVIDDFANRVLDQKGDRWQVPEVLKQAVKVPDAEGLPYAVAAIEAIDGAMRINQIDLRHLEAAQRTLREAHSRAYHWEAPQVDIEYRSMQPMRLYVRRWINEWDLRRLYNISEPLEFSGESIDVNFDEDSDIEIEPWDEG